MKSDSVGLWKENVLKVKVVILNSCKVNIAISEMDTYMPSNFHVLR